MAAVQAVITCIPVPDDVPSGVQWLAHETELHNHAVDGVNSPGEDKVYRAQIVPSNEVPGKNGKLILSNTASGKGQVQDGTYIYSVTAYSTPPKGTPEFDKDGFRLGGSGFRFWLANLDTCEVAIDLPGFDFNDNGESYSKSKGRMMVYVGAAP